MTICYGIWEIDVFIFEHNLFIGEVDCQPSIDCCELYRWSISHWCIDYGCQRTNKKIVQLFVIWRANQSSKLLISWHHLFELTKIVFKLSLLMLLLLTFVIGLWICKPNKGFREDATEGQRKRCSSEFTEDTEEQR